jgi:uncharacterized protein YfaS (alpha-2-macroglobulin family)
MQAQAAGNEEEWTRALAKEIQYRKSGSGYERILAILTSSPWPKSVPYRDIVGLYYARVLVEYCRAHAYQLPDRESVATKGPGTFKTWTQEQFFEEIQKAYLQVWSDRVALGKEQLARFSDIIQPNDYPPGIRDTLRDAFSYWYAEVLSDSSLWTAKQENEASLQDLSQMLESPQPGADADAARLKVLSDPSAHPLIKSCRILDDLELWHSEQGQPAACLESRLARARKLYGVLDQEADRKAIRKDLELRLKAYRTIPWWSMGMSLLAEYLTQEEAPDNLIRATAVARAGYEAYPSSLPGLKCKEILEDITAPDLSIEAMTTDGPDRRSVRVTHKNLRKLYFRAYLLHARERLERVGYHSWDDIDNQESQSLLRTSEPVARWAMDLPQTTDYKSHRTYIVPPMKSKGLYAIVASARRDFREKDNKLASVMMNISDLVLVVRGESGNKARVAALNGACGLPEAGVEITSYDSNRTTIPQKVNSITTGPDGVGFISGGGKWAYSLYLVAVKGEDVVACRYRSLDQYFEDEGRRAFCLIYTDRGAYRPNQKILFKIQAFAGRPSAGDYAPLTSTAVEVSLRAPGWDVVASQKLKTNEFGTAAGEFLIPAGRQLGNWTIISSIQGSASLSVEEYKRPTFEVTIKDPPSPLRLGRPAKVIGEARYYFGLPVTRGSVVWSVSRRPRYPWWWGIRGSQQPFEAETVARGISPLKPDGTFEIGFTAHAGELDLGGSKDVTYMFAVSADVTDEGGETRPGTRVFRMGATSVDASISSPGDFVSEGTPGAMTVTLQDLDGTPRSGRGDWKLVALKSPSPIVMPADEPLDPEVSRSSWGEDDYDEDMGGRVDITPGDAMRPRWGDDYSPERMLLRWKPGQTKAQGEVVHDATGKAEIALPGLSAGAYRLIYETKDDYGDLYTSSREFLVTSAGSSPSLPLWLAAEAKTVSVGGHVRLYVSSALPGQDLHLDIYRSGTRCESRIINSAEGPRIVDVEVNEQDRGGLSAMLWMVNDYQLVAMQETVQVPWDNKKLSLEFSSFRDKIQPGAKETFKVVMRGADGKALGAGVAEVLAYMYDRSLDLIARNDIPDLVAFYPNRQGFPGQETSLGMNEMSWDSRVFRHPIHYLYFGTDQLRITLGCDHASLWGQVMDEAGMPVIGAMLTVTAPSLLGQPKMTATDTDGQYCFSWLPPGKNYSIEIEAPGYNNARRKGIEIVEGVAINLPFTLSQGKTEIVVTAAAPVIAGEPQRAQRENAQITGNISPRDMDKFVFFAPGTVNSGLSMTAARTAPQAVAPIEPRTNFAETAFWQPGLLTGPDGSVSIEFTAPDSVTSWNLWVQAVTKELSSGIASKEVRTAKDLMVRPYLPRFFREGDRAQMRVVINNASDKDLDGTLDLAITNPVTGEDLSTSYGMARNQITAVPFSLKAGGGTTVAFPLVVPSGPGEVEMTATARAGNVSDGERRRVPVLPGRLHLVQSRFATLMEPGKRTLTFEDMARDDDPTRTSDQMVVTVDGQLFYTALAALPYLVRYPYECSEQTLNRYLSTSILTGLYDRYPEVAEMAKKMADRTTRVETWDAVDPNRKMALEETPWLWLAQGGTGKQLPVIDVLNPDTALAERETALARLEKSQLDSGAFPWWAGGRADPYMTLYILCGFSKGLEFGVPLPDKMVRNAGRYLHQYYLSEEAKALMARGEAADIITLLNYVLSNLPDPVRISMGFSEADRTAMLGHSFARWAQMPPYLRCELACTLKSMGRESDALMVFNSVMDAAKTTKDEGIFWEPSEQGWYWYDDSIETHAFILRTMLQLNPHDPRATGMVHWLLLNKKLNHWKSTRATAEVLYTLATYLRSVDALASRETARVTIGPIKQEFVFEPGEFTGKKNQVVVPGDKVDPHTMASTVIEKDGMGFMFASATWAYATDRLPTEGRGDLFAVTREYFKRDVTGESPVLKPLNEGASLEVGDEVEVHLTMTAKHPAEYIHLRDPRASGLEPEDLNSGYRWDSNLFYYQETRDSGTNFFVSSLPQGQYALTYRLRASMAGTFRVGPATVQSMYAPEFNAYSSGFIMTVGPGK